MLTESLTSDFLSSSRVTLNIVTLDVCSPRVVFFMLFIDLEEEVDFVMKNDHIQHSFPSFNHGSSRSGSDAGLFVVL